MSIDFQVQNQEAAGLTGESAVAAQLGLPSEVLQPLLQGARARGFVDALEAMGQAAVLIDATGAVLHFTTSAARLLGQGLNLVGGHLVGAVAETNQILGEVIGAALAGRELKSAITTGQGMLKVRSLCPGPDFEGPFQLFKAAILLEPAGLPDQSSNS